MLERLPKPVPVLLGNWNEEGQLRDAKLRDFLDRYAEGSLSFTRRDKRLAICNQVVEVGRLETQSPVMLLNVQTNGFLSASVPDHFPALKPGDQVALTTSKAETIQEPHARSTFRLEACPEVEVEGQAPPEDDGVVRFGRKYRIVAHAALHAQPLYLASGLKAPDAFASNFSKKKAQAAFLTTSKDYSGMWKFEYADPHFRYEMDGEPVVAGMKALVVHCATGKHLSSDAADVVRNDFAVEAGVCCDKLIHQSSHHEMPQNVWVFGAMVEGEGAQGIVA